MNISEFRTGFPGTLVKIPEGVHAFVPDSLPPDQLILERNTMNLLAEASLALGELKGVGKTLPNPHLLIGPLKAREALLSSKLEGTITTAEELVLADAQPGKKLVRDEPREVQNYVTALEFGLERLKAIPVSNRLIREIHEKLMRGVRGHEKRPGELRNSQNYIARRGEQIQQARFVPPPVGEMHRALGELESYLHSQDDLHALIRLALFHYQFESIHPFMDGNGRIGRLLIVLLLCEWRLLEQPLLYMSSYFARNEDAYRDLLLAVSQSGAWVQWIQFFLRGVVEQSQDAGIRSDHLLQLQKEYRDRVQSSRTSALTLKLVDNLLLSPWTSTSRAADLLQVTPRAAQNNIEKLVAAGILHEATGRSRDRIYVARGIIEIINRDHFE